MEIERTKKEIIIRIPTYVDTEGLQDIINFLIYKEATAKSQAKQEDVDQLTKDVKKGWWRKNRACLLK